MNCHEYIAKHGANKMIEVAKQAGTSAAYIRHILYGTKVCGRATANKLEAMSGGELKAADIVFNSMRNKQPIDWKAK
jgi:hypothetical protein